MTEMFYIETPDGIFFSDEYYNTNRTYYNSVHDLSAFYYDGKRCKHTGIIGWFQLDKVPTKVEKQLHQEEINIRWELIDGYAPSEKLPKTITRNDFEYDSEDDDYGPLYELTKTGLYERKSEILPQRFEAVECNWTLLFTFKKKVRNLLYDPIDTGDISISYKDIQHGFLEKLMLPAVLLPGMPCKLTSKQSYDIVRSYVKTHLDRNVATITGDYNFCFTVKKKVEYDEPLEVQIEIHNGKRKNPPRYRTELKEHYLVEVFEMTHDQENYKGYTVLPGFTGENFDDLVKNVVGYCEELIEYLNLPIKQCPHCQGTGVELTDKSRKFLTK